MLQVGATEKEQEEEEERRRSYYWEFGLPRLD
jgi:hypothetical protein